MFHPAMAVHIAHTPRHLLLWCFIMAVLPLDAVRDQITKRIVVVLALVPVQPLISNRKDAIHVLYILKYLSCDSLSAI